MDSRLLILRRGITFRWPTKGEVVAGRKLRRTSRVTADEGLVYPNRARAHGTRERRPLRISLN